MADWVAPATDDFGPASQCYGPDAKLGKMVEIDDAKLFIDFHTGRIGSCSGRKARSWMMRRIFRFCQYPIELNYFSADLADHAANDRTLDFWPRSTLICFVPLSRWR